MTRAALIVGLSGLDLTADEARFLSSARPFGIIVFGRNCEHPEQVRRLVSAAIAAIGDPDTLVLIDQEGGRVRRLRPPHWRDLPSARAILDLSRDQPDIGREAAFAIARLTAEDLRQIGINVSCAPVLDLAIPGAHAIIGDRAYGASAAEIVPLASAVIAGLMAGGVVPVIKHMPGHGRAAADSHLELPVVATGHAELTATDFVPFRELAHAPAAMTAHVVYAAIDPDRPASTSPRVIDAIIRREIGFDGLLMADDLGMRALSGTTAERAAAVIAAGCDVVLECSGRLEEATAAAAAVPRIDRGEKMRRFTDCIAVTREIRPFDRARAEDLLRMALAAEAARTPASV